MTEYVREMKRQLRDVYGFAPSRIGGNDEPCFDNVPDGYYPMTINGKRDHIMIVAGRFYCGNFDEGKPGSTKGGGG